MEDDIQKLRDLAFEQLISDKNITDKSLKAEIKRQINTMTFNDLEKELILNGEWGQNKKIETKAITQYSEKTNSTTQVLNYGVYKGIDLNFLAKEYNLKDRSELKKIVDNFFNTYHTPTKGDTLNERFQNWVKLFAYNGIENGKFSDEKLEKYNKLQLKKKAERREAYKTTQKEKQKYRDDAYDNWILGEKVKLDGKVYQNKYGVKLQILAANPNVNPDKVIVDMKKLVKLKEEYAKLTGSNDLKFSIVTDIAKLFNGKKYTEEDLKKIEKLGEEILALTGKLGSFANVSAIYKNARRNTVPAAIKGSKSYQLLLKKDASNIISEIDGVEKFITEQAFDALALHGLGKVVKGSTPFINKHATKAFSFIENPASKAAGKLLNNIGEKILGKGLTTLAKSPKTVITAVPYIAESSIKYELSSDLAHNITDKIEMSEGTKKFVDSAIEGLTNFYAFRDPTFALAKFGLDQVPYIDDRSKYITSGLLSHNGRMFFNNKLLGNSVTNKALKVGNILGSNLGAYAVWDLPYRFADNTIAKSISEYILPIYQHKWDRRIFNASFNLNAGSEGANTPHAVVDAWKRNIDWKNLFSFNGALKSRKIEIKISHEVNGEKLYIKDSELKLILETYHPEIAEKFKDNISFNNKELVKTLENTNIKYKDIDGKTKEVPILKRSNSEGDIINIKGTVPYFGTYLNNNLHPAHYGASRNWSNLPILNYSEVLNLAYQGIDPRFTGKYLLKHNGTVYDASKDFITKRLFKINENPQTIRDLVENKAFEIMIKSGRVDSEFIKENGMVIGNTRSFNLYLNMIEYDPKKGLKLWNPETGEIFYSKDIKNKGMVSEFINTILPDGTILWTNSSGHQTSFIVGRDGNIYSIRFDVNGPGSAVGSGKVKDGITVLNDNFIENRRYNKLLEQKVELGLTIDNKSLDNYLKEKKLTKEQYIAKQKKKTGIIGVTSDIINNIKRNPGDILRAGSQLGIPASVTIEMAHIKPNDPLFKTEYLVGKKENYREVKPKFYLDNNEAYIKVKSVSKELTKLNLTKRYSGILLKYALEAKKNKVAEEVSKTTKRSKKDTNETYQLKILKKVLKRIDDVVSKVKLSEQEILEIEAKAKTKVAAKYSERKFADEYITLLDVHNIFNDLIKDVIKINKNDKKQSIINKSEIEKLKKEFINSYLEGVHNNALDKVNPIRWYGRYQALKTRYNDRISLLNNSLKELIQHKANLTNEKEINKINNQIQIIKRELTELQKSPLKTLFNFGLKALINASSNKSALKIINGIIIENNKNYNLYKKKNLYEFNFNNYFSTPITSPLFNYNLLFGIPK